MRFTAGAKLNTVHTSTANTTPKNNPLKISSIISPYTADRIFPNKIQYWSFALHLNLPRIQTSVDFFSPLTRPNSEKKGKHEKYV